MVASQGSQWVHNSTSYMFYDLIIFLQRRIDSQWIVAKKDWREAKKRSKEQDKKDNETSNKQKGSKMPYGADYAGNDSDDTESGTYQQDMDEMRCILYSHGGTTSCSRHCITDLKVSRWLLFRQC